MVVFAVVALTAWRPALFALPGFVLILALGGLDRVIVTARGRSPAPDQAQTGPLGLAPSGADRDVDTDMATMVLPRLSAVDDPLTMQTMVIDMRELLEDNPAWMR
ncbi:hypothetical protein FsymDg_3581 [Candidatus Protofrankia datiscae]|uniref:Uncharacterized protein n=1 Tax=Candidatus Protofrankia datiscae TaxID=2716812 RepID=F8B2H8_9ACTN|nr:MULTISPECIES: hypothetical protein [Protofrankia]AEH10860.1 hypothetical protein FsymDg_3581 [Candidatus Protofrankia datiscae]